MKHHCGGHDGIIMKVKLGNIYKAFGMVPGT